MGGCGSKTQLNHVQVATLNFSGICLSPFEYHDGSVEKDVLSELCTRVMRRNGLDEKFAWKEGKLGQKLQQERYAPVYRREAGIQAGKLVTKQQFMARWDEEYQKAKTLLKEEPSATEVEQTRLFDWISYETIVNYLYVPNHKKDEYNWDRISQENPAKYQKFMSEWHSQPYLNIQKKMRKIAEVLQRGSIQVLFLQEAEAKGDLKWEAVLPEQFGLVSKPGSESLVIYSKSLFCFDKASAQFEEKYRNLINWNNDTVFLKSGNYLLASIHLSSKADKYTVQEKQMLADIEKLRKQNPKLNLVFGGDMNHFIQPSTCQNLQVFPPSEEQCTTAKKRTSIQMQSKKTNSIVIQSKDQILSSLPIKEGNIGTLSGVQVKTVQYLPTKEHPFDHYLVSGLIDFTSCAPCTQTT